MSLPNKIFYAMGYNNLGLIIEQERKHWLMKTDAKKQITDLNTGEVYQSEIDNIGSDIILESKKLPIKNDHHLNLDFRDPSSRQTFKLEYSAFPYSAGVGGLMYVCIKSMNYLTMDDDGNPVHNNYRLKLKNCEVVNLPFAGSINSPEVFASQWLRTTTPPSLLIPGVPNTGEFTEEVDLSFVLKCHECRTIQDNDRNDISVDDVNFCSFCGSELEEPYCKSCVDNSDQNTDVRRFCSVCGIELKFGSGITNLEYFYPLAETLQPLGLTKIKDGEWITDTVNSDSFIGYPLLWFNSTQTLMGPIATIENNLNINGVNIFSISNEGNASKYNSKVYCGINGDLDATPDGESTSDYEIRVSVNQNEDVKFSNDDRDFEIPLDGLNVRMINKSTYQNYIIPFVLPGNTKMFMSKVSTWRFINNNEYAIDMSTFDVNNFNIHQSVLVSVFDIHFDEMLPFVNETKNIGYAGMRASSANISSDVYEKYPHELNEWDGLPWYMNDEHPWSTPQHNALYAIHNSPGYTPGIPNSRQVAALLMDPGLSPWAQVSEADLENGTPPEGLFLAQGENRWSQIRSTEQVSRFESTLPYYYQINPVITPGINTSRMIDSGIYTVSFANINLRLTVHDSNDFDKSAPVWRRTEKWEILSELPWLIPVDLVKLFGKSMRSQSIFVESHDNTGVHQLDELGPIFELNINDEHYNWLLHGVRISEGSRGLYLSLQTKKTHFWTIKSIGTGYSVGDEFEFMVGPVQVHGRIQRMIDTPEPWYQDVPTYEYSLTFMNNSGFVPAAYFRSGAVFDYLTESKFRLRCPVCRDIENFPWNGKNNERLDFDENDEHTYQFDTRDPLPTHCDVCGAALMRGRGEGLVLTLNVDPVYWNWMISTGMLSNDQRGRVYVISNDPAEYENNEMTTFKKPARTVARICDIPTHMGQLQNINGVEQFPVVDNLYIRNTASFREEDLDRILNVHASRWVRPIHIDKNVKPVKEMVGEDNDYVFRTIGALNAVDLINHNDFRMSMNINSSVDPRFVQVAEIIDHGEGYREGDTGIVIVGGFSFSFDVKSTHPIHQGGVGQVLELNFYPTNPTQKIHLSNFNFQVTPESAGITIPYGTSTVTGNGSGLTFTMRIINYDQVRLYKGEIFKDLYALVDMTDGLWMWNYHVDMNTTAKPRRGSWVKEVQLSFKDNVSMGEGDDDIETLDMRESFLTSVIPSLTRLGVNLSLDHEDPTTVLGYQTANFVNIIESEKTPLNDNPVYTNNIDMSKFVCKEIIQVNEKFASKTGDAVFNWLKENHRLWFDCYVIWRWINPGTIGESLNDHRFEYGIITRSFNNFMSTDRISKLPSSRLRYKRYIHTNIGTHVVWPIEKIGTMMWTYNPRCEMKESYTYDPSVKEIKMQPIKPFTWADIDIRNHEDRSDSDTVNKMIDDNGNILWNVMTNNPLQANPDGEIDLTEPIYQQPEFTSPYWISKNTKVVNINPETKVVNPVMDVPQPIGMWQLVFPDVTHFSLRTENPNLEIQHFDPVRLQTIRTVGLENDAVIEDIHGDNINNKTLLINDNGDRLRLRVYSDQNRRFNDL